MYTRLLLPILFILLECSLCIKHVAGYFIHIDAHAEECFFDRVTSGTKLSLMFEVAEGGFLDIDVKVSLCAGVTVFSERVINVWNHLPVSTNFGSLPLSMRSIRSTDLSGHLHL